MSTNFPNSLDSFINPTPADKLSGTTNPSVIHSLQHSNENDAISALEQKLGINFSNNPDSVDYALQIVFCISNQHPKGKYREIIGSPFPLIVTWYTDPTKTIKLVEKQYTYGPGTKKFVTQVDYFLYDGTVANIIKRTITDTISIIGAFEINRSRVISP